MVAAGSITVAVRVRPPTSWEAARLPAPSFDSSLRGDGALSTPAPRPHAAAASAIRDIVQIVDDRILTFDPDEKDRAKAFVERGFLPPGTKRYKDKRFMFDKVFDHDARQQDVYESTSQPLLHGLLDGYNATVFAYGATGCGKTHTISGTETDPGIIYLTMADLFQRINDRRDDWNVEVTVTFLEIYNEEIRDLLSDSSSPSTPRGGLSIREDKSVKVVGLTELHPTSADEVKQIVLQGNARRTQSPTHANETSSRSHAVLQVHVTQSPRTAAVTEQRTMATLSIIDLAGSERAAATSNMGQRMVEGANINKSLLALGNCINALCESGGAIRHVPYRNSKLTRLLKFSLGGNCKTVMIVCIAPTSLHFDDTHNTLLYAERATKIKTKVVTRNVVNVDRHVGRYVEAINRLNIEVAELKAKIAGKLSAENDILRRKKAEASAEVDRAKNDMQTKAEQTQTSIVDGATCSGMLAASGAKLRAIRARLAVLDASSPLSADLEAERGLLRALAAPEEQAEAGLQTRLARSSNAGHMFDATIRAMSERRSERLDQLSVDNVRMDARWRRAEMERAKAEAARMAVQSAVEQQAEMVVNLMGIVGRCTVMMDEAARALRRGEDVEKVASSLAGVAKKNDEAFRALVDHETAGYVREEHGALESFTEHTTTFIRSTSGGASSTALAKGKAARRTSSYDAVGLGASPGRRTYRFPRKSLRSSLAGQPYRRVPSGKEREKKTLQWRDEAGQGDIDDGGVRFPPPAPPAIAITPAEEPQVGPRSGRSSSMSMVGSESDWEDEKTEDSVHVNGSFLSASTSSLGPRRSRASRLDPGFLKSKTRGGSSALGSLTECDESTTREPLGDRSMNSLAELHISKRGSGSPEANGAGRRGPTTPHMAGKARRRSNIGPMRNEKGRRRSSMIPQPSPSGSGEEGTGVSGARRMGGERSPAKRSRRLSVLNKGSLRVGKSVGSTSLANVSVGDLNGSGDLSFRGAKPTWR